MYADPARTYLADHHPVGRSGGSKSSPPEAGIGGNIVLDGRRRDGDAEDQCSSNEGKWSGNHGDYCCILMMNSIRVELTCFDFEVAATPNLGAEILILVKMAGQALRNG